MQDAAILSKSTTRVLSGLIIFLSLTVLAGWMMNIPVLKSVYPGWAPMPAPTAVSFILFSAALWFMSTRLMPSKISIITCVALALIISPLPSGGHTSLITVINFCIIGSGFILMMGNTQHQAYAQYFFLVSLFIPTMVVIGYIYANPAFFYLGSFDAVSFITAVLFLLLSFIALFSNPTAGVASIFSSRGPGGTIAKYLVPTVIVIPIAFGYSRLAGVAINAYNRELDISLTALLTIFSITPIIWFTAVLVDNMDKKLQKSKANLALALSSAKAGSWLLNLITNELIVDDQCRHMLGLDKTTPFSNFKDLLNIIHPEDRTQVDTDIKSAILDHADYSSDFRVTHPDKAVPTLTARGKAYYNQQGTPSHMNGILWDITDQKKTEEELRSAKLRAESADKMKSEFLANMTHELRAPLNTIIGYSEMLRDRSHKENLNDYNVNLVKVVDSAKHLLDLINDVLDLSKMEAGKMDLFFEKTNADLILKDLETYTSLLFNNSNNIFTATASPDIGPFYSDTLRLRQSLLNLLTNANKFTQNGKITLNITTSILNTIPMIHFTVTDTGIGMSEKTLSKLFQRFAQGDSSITRKYGGTGLGLYLTKQFCALLGGDITVTSKERQGSAFTLTLPIRSPLVDEQDQRLDHETLGRFKGKKVLMISNKLAVFSDIDRDLRKAGFSVLKASNGTQGIKLARTGAPDIIALDISNAVSLDDALMDEWIALSELKTDPVLSKIPTIVMTLGTPEESLGFLVKHVDFLTKPVNRKLFSEKVNRLVPEGIPSLLIVDDDSSAREVLAIMVRENGWTYTEAKNGKEAIDILKKQRPSLIILDLMMPEMDGFAVIDEMQKNPVWQNIPIIISSAKNLSPEERETLAKYTQGILQKGATNKKDLFSLISENLK